MPTKSTNQPKSPLIERFHEVKLAEFKRRFNIAVPELTIEINACESEAEVEKLLKKDPYFLEVLAARIRRQNNDATSDEPSAFLHKFKQEKLVEFKREFSERFPDKTDQINACFTEQEVDLFVSQDPDFLKMLEERIRAKKAELTRGFELDPSI